MYQRDEREAIFSSEVEKLANDAEDALKHRNLIVHGVWPHNQPDRWLVWKSKSTKTRRAEAARNGSGEPDSNWIESEKLTSRDFVQLCTVLSALIDRIGYLTADAGSIERRE